MNEHKGRGGVSFVCVLAIVFIVLKLCDVIKWSWLWVLSPLWISAVISIIPILIFIILIRRDKK